MNSASNRAERHATDTHQAHQNRPRARRRPRPRIRPGVASILRTGVQIDFCPENTDFVPKARPASLREALRAGTTGLSPGF